MDDLRSAAAKFSSLLDRAARELPLLTDAGARNDGRWSRKEILGHLIDSAANNHQRFVRAQLDRELISPGYAQEQWVETERFNEREWSELVQFWLAYNRHLLHLINHVRAAALEAAVRIGADNSVTLEFVMIDYVRHLKHHLEQIGVHAAIE